MQLEALRTHLRNFMPVSRSDALERIYRKGWTVLATLGIAMPVSSILNNAPEMPLQTTVVHTSVGKKGYTLPARYSGLTAFENVESATVSLTDREHDRVPRYHFDLFNRLAFEGENMFDVDRERISPALRADFNQVYLAFCSRHATYQPLSTESRFATACHPQP